MIKIFFALYLFSNCIIFNSCKKESPGNTQQQQIAIPIPVQANSKVLFWTKDPYDSNHGYGIVPVEITINNYTKTLWSYYEFPGPSAPLACSNNATLRFDLIPGTYTWNAWQPGLNKKTAGSFTIMANQCLTQELVF